MNTKITKIIASIMLIVTLFNFTSNNKNSSVSAADTSTRTTLTDGGVSVTVSGNDAPDWSSPLQMEVGTIYDVLVTASFEDVTSDNKELVFTLPEGLEFVQIPVVEGAYNTSGVDVAILSTLPSDDPRVSSTANIELPQKETVSNGGTYGVVKYTFTPEVRTVSMGFKVQVHNAKFYATHIVPENMIATASKSGSSIGEISGQIEVVGANRLATMVYNGIATEKTLANTATESYSSVTYNNYINFTNSYRLFKDLTMYVYYPEGADFVGMDGNIQSEWITNDPENSRVIISSSSDSVRYIGTMGFKVSYEFKEGTPPGIYTPLSSAHATIETYDGQLLELKQSAPIRSVEVVDELIPPLKLTELSTGVDSTVDAYTNAPAFRVVNDTTVTAKNTVAHFQIEEALIVNSIYFPFDRGLNSEPSKIEYKTKNNNSWVVASADVISSLAYGSKFGILKIDDLNLADGDKVTEIKFHVGDIRAGFDTYDFLAYRAVIGLRATLEEGTLKGSATLTTYSNDAVGDTTVSKTATITNYSGSDMRVPSNGSVTFKDTNNAGTSTIIAGDTFKLTGTARTHGYPYGNVRTLVAPEIYIYEQAGMTVAINTLVLTDNNGNPVDYTVTKSQATDGANVYIISTSEDILIGHYIGDNIEERWLNYSVDVATDLRLGGNFNSREMVSFGSADNVSAVGSYGIPAYTDQFDIDGDGSTTDTLLSHANKTLSVQENNNVLVESFLSLDGEEPGKAYIEGDDSTISNFTPGTNADYTIKVTNNGASDVTAFTSYVPVPKAGENFGSFFQDEAFNWDTKLTGEVTAQAGFEIKYGVGVTEGDFETYSYMTYAELISAGYSLDDVNMVVINAVSNFTQGAEAEFVIPFNVAETFESANDGNKIGTMNVYRPAYDVDSPTYSGRLTGTKVGEELVIAEIGGMAFMDVDADGLYISANGDTVIAGHEVELYVLNETTGSYDPALDESGNHIKTTTDSNGVYVFDYTVASYTGAIVNRTFAVRFVEVLGADVYQYTPNVYIVGSETINSDAIIANDIPNPGDTYRGWVLGIDPTSSEAKTIGVGFLKYNPPVDLKLTLSAEDREVMVGESIVVKPELIEPDFWDNIKAKDGAYTWELVNASDSQYVTLTNTNQKSVGVEGLLETPEGYTVEVRLTIKDIYNTEVSAIANIKVTPLPVPVIEANDFTLDVSEVAGLTEASVIEHGNATVVNELDGTAMDGFVINADYSNIEAKAGSYDVIYTTADGLETIVRATVGENLGVNNGLAIDANNTFFTLEEVNAMNVDEFNAELVVRSEARAWVIETNQTLTPVSADSSAVDLANVEKGSYDVVYKYQSSTNQAEFVETIARATIADAASDVDAIAANDFALAASEVADLTAEKVIDLASARAWLISDNSDVEIVDVDFSAIKAEQGVFDVVFTTSYGTTLTVQAFVGETNRPTIDNDNNIVIFADDYEIKDTQVPNLTLEDHVKLSNALIIDKDTYEELEITYIDTTAVEAKEGVYSASFGTQNPKLRTTAVQYKKVAVTVTTEGTSVPKTGMSMFNGLLALILVGFILIVRTCYRKLNK